MTNAIGEVFLLAGLLCFVAKNHARLVGQKDDDPTLLVIGVLWILFGGIMVITRTH
jgi:hypothetical protein